MAYERNRLQLYKQFLQLLLQLAQREVTITIVQKTTYESFTDSCEQFTEGYGLVRVICTKINPWTSEDFRHVKTFASPFTDA